MKSMSKKGWIIFAALVVLAVGGLIIFSEKNKVDVDSIDANTILPTSQDNGNIADHVYGKADSKVILINYGDFQCSGCGAAHPRIKAIVEEYQDQIAFVFRNYPITSSHPNAKFAAASAEAAGLQGKYWEMYDLIYDSQSEWESLSSSNRLEVFLGYARQIGLDENQFKSDLSNNDISKKIALDQELGKKVGVDATPTFFLNGQKLDSSIWGDDTNLKSAIDTELAKYDIEPPAQTE